MSQSQKYLCRGRGDRTRGRIFDRWCDMCATPETVTVGGFSGGGERVALLLVPSGQTLNASPAVVVVTIPQIFPPLKNNETQMVMRNDSLSISTFPRQIQSTYNLEFIRDSGDIRQIQPPSQITSSIHHTTPFAVSIGEIETAHNRRTLHHRNSRFSPLSLLFSSGREK